MGIVQHSLGRGKEVTPSVAIDLALNSARERPISSARRVPVDAGLPQRCPSNILPIC